MPWISWSPQGDRIAYFVRSGKYNSLVIQNVLTKKIERKIDLDTVDEPDSPDFSPDGTKVIFSALRRAVGDIFEVDLNKQTIFPLVHLIVNSATFEGSVVRYNISIMAMDIVDITKDETVSKFDGNNNELWVLNTMLQVLN